MRLFCPTANETEVNEKDMQTQEMERTGAQGEPKEAMPTKREKIGGTTYIVKSFISPTATETMENKIRRMMKQDIESGNF